MTRLTQDLVGKWMVYYGASGFAARYGEIISVKEGDEIIYVIDGITKKKEGFGKYNFSVFETEAEAKEEYDDYQLVSG